MNTLETTDRNGARVETPPISWRDQAMNEALRGFDYDEHVDALIHAIRRRLPEAATLTIWPDRLMLMRFLDRKTTGRRSLLSASHLYQGAMDGECREFFSWSALEWEGESLEIVIAPDHGSNLDVVCLAPSADLLRRFSAAVIEYSERPAGRSLRYAAGWEHAPDLDAEIGKVDWDDIVLAPEMMARLRDAIEGFAHNRRSYDALGFAWRRGVLLVGPPGTGKTMVCKAAASALPEFPFLYVRDLTEYNEEEGIKQIFRRARKLAPCILAFEDLDGLVNDNNRTIFLNELDGFKNNEGLLVIASSNHPEKIDVALLRRPSRFDRVFHIGLPEAAERREFCLRTLSRPEMAARMEGVDIAALSRRVADLSRGFTPAYLKEVIVAAALQRAQAGAVVLDDSFAEAVVEQVQEMRKHLKRTQDPEAMADMSGGLERLGFRRGDD